MDSAASLEPRTVGVPDTDVVCDSVELSDGFTTCGP